MSDLPRETSEGLYVAAENFKSVMTEIFAHEGGYVNHRTDPGGETNYGISKRAHPGEDIRNMTRARAEEIYRVEYWHSIHGDDLPGGVDLATMDPAVNSGVSRGVKWMQKAAGLKGNQLDGKMGPKTISAIFKKDPVPLIQNACAIRMGFLRGLRTWGTFGNGWSRRVASIEAKGVAMALAATNRPIAPTMKAEADTAATRSEMNRNASTVAPATGGASVLTDLPEWGIVAIIILFIVIGASFLGRAKHEKEREKAYRAQLVKATQ